MYLIGMEVDSNVDNIEDYRKHMEYQENKLIHLIATITNNSHIVDIKNSNRIIAS